MNMQFDINDILDTGCALEHTTKIGSYGVTQAERLPLGPSSLAMCPRQIAIACCGTLRQAQPAKRAIVTSAGTALHGALEDWLRLGAGALGYTSLAEQRARVPILIDDARVAQHANHAINTIRERGYKGPLPQMQMHGLGGPSIVLQGSIDTVLEHEEERVTHLIEIKTMHAFKYKMTLKEGPSEDHRLQAMAYLLSLFLQRNDPKRIFRSTFIFVDRSSGAYTPMPFMSTDDYAPERFSTIEELAEPIQVAGHKTVLRGLALAGMHGCDVKALPDEQLVPFPAKVGPLPWPCNYCSFGPIVGGCFPKHRVAVAMKDGAPSYSLEERDPT